MDNITRWKLIIRVLVRDPIMQVALIMMINGWFYSLLAEIIGAGSTVDVMDIVNDVLKLMYIWVLPAHIFYPKTIEADEIITIN